MTLATGTKLGPYEILSPIGAGGMGEVYRARDSRLSREVAVKVLPASFAADAERLRRFEQEARAASALNHPNIVAIYDIGVQDGVSYIAMELVDGASLRELGASGPLPPRRVLDISAQVADGLAKAHAAGIVHRDLKPENVMVSKDGFVKILDFGLAKAQGTPSDGGSQMPTTAPETGAGMVLGTVAYMSPEQASGRRVDYRSDQFSLGTVLYELVSGKRPFEKPTAVETMSAIIREDPPPISQSGVTCPAPLRWILDRCHAKEPEGRYASTLDLARELKGLRDHYSELSSSSAAAEASTAAPPRRRGGAAGLAALAAAFVLGGAVVRLVWRPAPPPSPSLQYLTYAGQDQSPAASPDGTLVAFSSTRDGKARIWLHQVRNGTETALTAGQDTDPRFSPDGSAILYTKTVGGRFSLYRVSVLGGEERRVIDDAIFGDWSPDGRKIVFARLGTSGLNDASVLTCESDGSGEKLLVKRDGNALAYPRWSPDGKLIAAAEVGAYAPGLEAFLLVDPADGKSKEIPSSTGGGSIHGLVWSSSDSLLYEATLTTAAPGTAGGPSVLYQQPIRGGAARPVFSLPANGSAVDVLAEGDVVLDMLSQRENLRLSPLDTKTGAAARWLTHGIATDRQPIFSPDGKWVIFSSGRNGFINIWKIALATGELRRLTETSGVDWDPTFTPDGRSIVFSSNRTGHFEIWSAEADGSHPTQVTHENLDCENPAVSPDGVWIYFVEAIGKRSGNWRVHPDGSGSGVFLPGSLGIPEISPDNSLLAAQGRINALSVISTAGDKTVISRIPAAFDGGTLGGRYRWLPGTHTLVFSGFDGAGRAGLFAQDVGPGIPIRPRRFSAFESDTAAETFDVSPDGKSLVTAEQELQANIYSLKNVPGVRRRSPKAE